MKVNCEVCRNFEPKPRKSMEIELWKDDVKRISWCRMDLAKDKNSYPTTYTFELPQNICDIARDAFNMKVKVHMWD